jgi:hypothetical protein
MDDLSPDRLKSLWQAVERSELTAQAFADEEARLLSESRRTWEEALLLDGHRDRETSALGQIGAYVGARTSPRFGRAAPGPSRVSRASGTRG